MITNIKNSGTKHLFVYIDDKIIDILPGNDTTIDLSANHKMFISFDEKSKVTYKFGCIKFNLILDVTCTITKLQKGTIITCTNKKANFFSDSTKYEWIDIESNINSDCITKEYSVANHDEIIAIYRTEFKKTRMFDVLEPSGLLSLGVIMIAVCIAMLANIWSAIITLLLAYILNCVIQACFTPNINNRAKRKTKDVGYPDDMFLFTNNIACLVQNPPDSDEFWWDYWERTKGL